MHPALQSQIKCHGVDLGTAIFKLQRVSVAQDLYDKLRFRTWEEVVCWIESLPPARRVHLTSSQWKALAEYRRKLQNADCEKEGYDARSIV